MARGGRVSAPYSASSSKLPKKGKSNGSSGSSAPKKGGNQPANGSAKATSAPKQPEIADTYTYTPATVKRSRTSAHHFSLSKDEAGPSTRRRRDDEEEDEDAAMEERIRQVAMRIAGDELLDLDESEESDVDSDEAWESDGSDEERWGDVFRDLDKGKGKKGKSKAQEVVKKPSKHITVNLDESDDEIPASKTAAKPSVKKGKQAAAEPESDEEEEEEEDDEELDSDSEKGEEEDDSDDELDDDEEDEFAQMAAGSEDDVEEASEDEGGDSDDDVDLKAFKPGKFAAPSSPAGPADSDDEEDDEDEDEDEEEEESGGDEHISDPELPSDLSDEDEDDADLDDLDAFVDGLNAGDADDSDEGEAEQVQGKKRKVLPVVPGPAVGEVGLQSNGKLDITSLLSSHPSLSSARALLPSRSAPSADASTSILKSGVLSAPLPTVVQDRLDREAAYERTKEEGQKWSGVMRRVREAEHLSFPLQAGEARGGVKSGGEMVSAFKPANAMESAVQALLDKANLNTEQGLTAAEDAQLQGQDLSVEEIAAKRAELRYQRELMFRAEKRAKRVAKIKSKTFRKLARKRAEKEGAGGLSVEDLEKLDPEAAEAEREKLERHRARERATLRHGARTKFGADALKGDFGNEDRRKAREEMLNTRERLSRKIAGRASDEEFDSASETDSDSDADAGSDEDGEGIKSRAFDQIAALDKAHKAEVAKQGGKKGLMNMAFMQRAQERGMQAARDEEDAARRDIEMFGLNAEDGDSSDEAEGGEMMRLGEGRMVFSGPVGTESSSISKATSPAPAATSSLPQSRRPLLSNNAKSATSDDDEAAAANPWLTASSSTAGPSRKRTTTATGSASAAEKATAALKKEKGTRGRVEMEMEDGRVDIDLGMRSGAPKTAESAPATATAGPSKSASRPDALASAAVRTKAPGAAAAPTPSRGDGEMDVESEDEDAAQRSLLPTATTAASSSTANANGKRPQADFTSQRDLVAEAFAGDDVISDFQRDKKRQMEADAPAVQDTSLPGWGAWSGKGLKKRKPNPKFLVKTAGVETAQRKDFGRDNVIISERTEKRAKQFLAKDLPYPYTSVAQYEASFNTPVGAEWNSRKVHQRETMPRVIKKPGAIIEPVRRLF